MRIGIDITKALPPSDGVGYYTCELVRALSDLAADPGEGCELHLYCLDVHGRDGALELAALEELLPDRPDTVHPRTGAMSRDDLDVFHATAWRFPAAWTGPLVSTCHDLTFLTHPHFHTVSNKVHGMTWTLNALLAGASFLAVSAATARELEAQLGLPSSSVRVVHSAASAVFRPVPEDEARVRLTARFDLDGPFVFAAGTLEPRKNLQRLAEAFAGLPADLRESHPLVIAGGDGWRFDAAALDPSVRRLGFVDREDLVALYSATAVFAYPSVAEGFGLPVLEAMACGAPVLTSNVSSLPEVAGGAARLVDPHDVGEIRAALLDLIERPAERRRLSERGLERAASFSWETTARETLELYREAAFTT